MSNIVGVNIKEVWDFRLSKASCQIVRRENWECEIICKNGGGVLETHDSGIPYTQGDAYDCEKLKPCFEWFKSRRDDYALENIEELKPGVAKINEENAKLAAKGSV